MRGAWLPCPLDLLVFFHLLFKGPWANSLNPVCLSLAGNIFVRWLVKIEEHFSRGRGACVLDSLMIFPVAASLIYSSMSFIAGATSASLLRVSMAVKYIAFHDWLNYLNFTVADPENSERGPSNVKNKLPHSVNIFFMTTFYRPGGGGAWTPWPLNPPWRYLSFYKAIIIQFPRYSINIGPCSKGVELDICDLRKIKKRLITITDYSIKKLITKCVWNMLSVLRLFFF